mgnify:CR=1 FL=1
MPIKLSDGNKHLYISCVGAQGGKLAAMETLAGGAWKEIKDLNQILSANLVLGIKAETVCCCRNDKNSEHSALKTCQNFEFALF